MREVSPDPALARRSVVYLVRHATAGLRTTAPDDDQRPLDPEGRRQASAIAAVLDLAEGALVMSSPATRCRQTVEPLADRHGAAVGRSPALAESSSPGGVIGLLERAPAGTVLCTHGDVIEPTIDLLLATGTALAGPACWDKGTVWVLTRQDGEIVAAEAVGPSSLGATSWPMGSVGTLRAAQRTA
jgi:8-oxo-(d)GTP phosphatase